MLKGKTLFITGASRGIGKCIALKAAKDGANIVVAAKTAEAHPKLDGTIFTAAKEIEAAGGQALPIVVDVRHEENVQDAFSQAAQQFGGIDAVINNASAISLTGTLETTMKKYDLMNQVNGRGTFVTSKAGLPYLLKSQNPHILNISPPLLMTSKWFKNHCAYTTAKYGMSLCVLGMSAEFKDQGVAVNALWPRTGISTAAMDMMQGKDNANLRTPQIMADAAYEILSSNSRENSGNFYIDEEILRARGVTDFDQYACKPGEKLLPDFFIDVTEKDVDLLQDHDIEKGAENPDVSDLEKVISGISSKISADAVKKIGAVYLFDLGSDGSWYLDLASETGSISREAPTATPIHCTMKMNSETFIGLIGGKVNATVAVMTGKIQISGDMTKALKLDALLKMK